jgi:hypothetical protein
LAATANSRGNEAVDLWYLQLVPQTEARMNYYLNREEHGGREEGVSIHFHTLAFFFADGFVLL